ncbi:TPA: hypothetical protein ACT2HZ_001282 [Streptococcus suis]
MRKWFSFCMVLFASLLLSSCRVTISHSPAQSVEAVEQTVRPHVDVWQTAYRALVNKWDKMEGQELTWELLSETLLKEKELFASLRGATFDEPSYQGMVELHLDMLDQGQALLGTYDEPNFTSRWAAYEEKAKFFYRWLDYKGGLHVPEEYELTLDKFLAGPAQLENITQTEQTLNELLETVTISQTDQTYGNGYPVYQGQLDNSLGLSIKKLCGKVFLENQAGTVVDERFFVVEDWVENGRATIDFITPKTFEQTELVLDYFVAQWPWQPVEDLGGN